MGRGVGSRWEWQGRIDVRREERREGVERSVSVFRLPLDVMSACGLHVQLVYSYGPGLFSPSHYTRHEHFSRKYCPIVTEFILKVTLLLAARSWNQSEDLHSANLQDRHSLVVLYRNTDISIYRLQFTLHQHYITASKL